MSSPYNHLGYYMCEDLATAKNSCAQMEREYYTSMLEIAVGGVGYPKSHLLLTIQRYFF